jgi:hypothetical protein
MTLPVRRAGDPKGIRQKREDFFHPIAQLETRKLKLTGKVTHVFARGGQQLHTWRGRR